MEILYILVPLLPAMAIITSALAVYLSDIYTIKGKTGNPKPRPPTDLENK